MKPHKSAKGKSMILDKQAINWVEILRPVSNKTAKRIFYKKHPLPKEWHLNGKLHRENGPAMVYKNGIKAWFIKGLLHRKDGPAIEYPNGNKYWFQNGKLHRADGPACEVRSIGSEAWWLYGKKYTKKTHKILTELSKLQLLLLMGQGHDDYIEQRLKEP